MSVKEQKPIVIFRGDNTAAFDLRTITILLTGDLDLTNATARFDLLGFTKSWTTEEVATGELSIVFDSAQTKAFALGPQMGTLRLFDMSTGTPRQLTVVNKIPFFVTNNVCEIDSQSYGINVSVTSGETIHIEFNVGLDSVEGKADKVEDATAGDLASLTEDGNLEDSGIPKTDVQRKLTFDTTPTEGSQNPVTSDGIKQAIGAATPEDYAQVKEQVEQNASAISTINSKIPNQASADNQLADKNFVNSSIATNTATFRGSYNLVSDLGLTVSATEQQVAAAIAAKLASLVPPVVPENNDYCFVQVPKTDADPTIIERVDRYKCTVTESGGVTTRAWEYEWSLNNSSFTADQWAAINSGITSGLVDKLVNLPTAEEIAAKGYVLFDPSNGGSDKNHFNATSSAFIVRSTSAYSPTATSSTAVCKGFLIDLSAYAITTLGQSSIVTPVIPADPLTNYIDACHRVAVTSLMIYLRVGSTVNAESIRAIIKSADGSTTLATSSFVTVTSPSSVVAYTFEFPSSTVWYDNGTQYRVEFEYDDPNLTYYAQLYPILGQNSVYTYAANKGVKWSLITEDAQSGETVTEVTDKCVNMTVSATMDVTVTIPVANLLDIGYSGFSPLKKYALNEKCVKDGILYECKNSSGHGPAPWSANNFRAVLRLDDNITIGKGASVYGPSTQLKNNIVVGLNTASAAGTNNVVLGYSAQARCTQIGSPTGSDDTTGNVVIGFSAAADNANNTRYAPMDSVVVGKYAKMHGSYGIVLGVAAEVTEDKGVAIGTEAVAKGEAAAAVGYQASANPDFVNTKAYEVGDIVVQGSYAYKCILAVSAATIQNPNPSPPQDGTHWQLLDGVTISTARSLAVGNDARTTGEGAVAIGSGARAREDNSIAIGNGAKSNGQGTATLAINALNKFYLGSDNIVDLINAAVNAAIANATIPAAVSTTTATGGGRRLLAAATPTSTTKTEVTAADIGAVPTTGGTMTGTLNAGAIISALPSDSNREASIAKIDLAPAGTLRKGQGKLGYVLSLKDGTDRECSLYIDDDGKVYINTPSGYVEVPNATAGGTLALLSQIYAAIQQIAPDFTAKAYSLNELCSYNGVVYRCKSAYTATASSTKPNVDTTHWTEATVQDVLAAIRSALDLKAPLESPAFTGTPTAPTPTSGDNTTKVATTAFVQDAVRYNKAGSSSTVLADRTANPVNVSVSSVTLTLPAVISGKVCDFFVDVQNNYTSGGTPAAATIDFTGLGSSWDAVVNSGDALSTMTTLGAGEMARFHFALTAFVSPNNLPVFHIVKQVVAFPQAASYSLNEDGTVSTDAELNANGTVTIDAELNTDGTVTVEAQ